MKIDIITIFPKIFDGFLSESLISKAIKKRLISIRTHYLRKWTTDKHQTVDGKPYGGGPGLVLKIEPIFRAVNSIQLTADRKNLKTKNQKLKSRIILFSPRGKQMDQQMIKRWAKHDQLIFICGRYEGVDERVADYIADEVVSVGPFVLNGGEVAAMAAIEAVSRLIPGFMHDVKSQTKGDHPQYTRPEEFRAGLAKGGKARIKIMKVPKVLLSGNHAKIATWRKRKTGV